MTSRRAGRWILGALLLQPFPALAERASPAGGIGFLDVISSRVASASELWQLEGTRYSLGPLKRSDSDEALVAYRVGLAHLRPVSDRAALFARVEGALLSSDSATDAGLADGLVGVHLDLWRPRHDVWFSGVVRTTIPFGDSELGLSTDEWDTALMIGSTWELPVGTRRSEARLHVNVGVQRYGAETGRGLEGDADYFAPTYPAEDNELFLVRAALELRIPRTSLFLEGVFDQFAREELSWSESPVFANLGFRHRVGGSVELWLASKVSFAADDFSTEVFRAPEALFPDWQLHWGLTFVRPR